MLHPVLRPSCLLPSVTWRITIHEGRCCMKHKGEVGSSPLSTGELLQILKKVEGL